MNILFRVINENNNFGISVMLTLIKNGKWKNGWDKYKRVETSKHHTVEIYHLRHTMREKLHNLSGEPALMDIDEMKGIEYMAWYYRGKYGHNNPKKNECSIFRFYKN